MTVFAPATHSALFLKSSTGIASFSDFYSKAEAIWGIDFVLSALAASGVLNITISDTAPVDTDSIWVDPGNPATDTASTVKLYNAVGTTWETATSDLFVKAFARQGNFPDLTADIATIAELEAEAATSKLISVGTLATLLNMNTGDGRMAIGIGAGGGQIGEAVIGSEAGDGNTGTNLAALGRWAARNNTGSAVVAVGYLAGENTQGNANVLIGSQAGRSANGGAIVAIGDQAGVTATASEGVMIGYRAGYNASGIRSVFVGQNAGDQSASQDSVIIGRNAALSSTGSNLIAIGHASAANVSGTCSIVLGNISVAGDMIGDRNIVVGNFSSAKNMNGSDNIVIGNLSTGVDVITNRTISIGRSAGRHQGAQFSIAIGDGAGCPSKGATPIAIGLNAASGADRSTNLVAVGAYSGRFDGGDNNTFIGVNAGPTTFTPDVAFAGTLDVETQEIDAPGHGVAIGVRTTTQLVAATTVPSGLALNGIYVTEATSANRLRIYGDPFTTAGAGLQWAFNLASSPHSNTSCIGYNATASKDNQIVLGDGNVDEVYTAGTYRMGIYTPATLPASSLSTRGSIAYITGGTGTGQAICLVHDDGTNWRKAETGVIQA